MKTYTELEALGAEHWVTEGPNREGVSGYLLYERTIYYFYQEMGMPEPLLSTAYSIEEFIKTFGETQHRVIKEIIAKISR